MRPERQRIIHPPRQSEDRAAVVVAGLAGGDEGAVRSSASMTRTPRDMPLTMRLRRGKFSRGGRSQWELAQHGAALGNLIEEVAFSGG